MAQLVEVAEWSEAQAYLSDLRNTVAGDIRPLLSSPGSAPFAVFRETMSYVDHLGHLYSGRDKVVDRFVAFLRGPLALVDASYAQRADELYQMYRNGSIHEFQPKVLENDHGERLGWLSYRGDRRSQRVDLDFGTIVVTHLVPAAAVQFSSYWLPVCLDCLVLDLEQAIDHFARDNNVPARVTAWNRAARRLVPPMAFNFKL